MKLLYIVYFLHWLKTQDSMFFNGWTIPSNGNIVLGIILYSFPKKLSSHIWYPWTLGSPPELEIKFCFLEKRHKHSHPVIQPKQNYQYIAIWGSNWMCRGPVWNLSSYFTCQCTKAKPTKGWITHLPLGPRHPQASEVRDSLYVSPKPICYYQRRTVTLYVFLRLNDFLKQMDNVVFR